MSLVKVRKVLRKFQGLLETIQTPLDAVSSTLKFINSEFSEATASLSVYKDKHKDIELTYYLGVQSESPPTLPHFTDGKLILNEVCIESTLIVADHSRILNNPSIVSFLNTEAIKSYLLVRANLSNGASLFIELRFRENFHRFSKEEVFIVEEIAFALSQRISLLNFEPKNTESRVTETSKGIQDDEHARIIEKQSLIVDALYEVARTTQIYHDPAIIMLKGLQALVKATKSDSALGAYYYETNDEIEIAATQGLSQKYIEEIQHKINGKILLRQVIETKQGMLIDNIQENQQAIVNLMKMEDLKSTIIVPIIVDEKVLGGIVLYKRQAGHYRKDDYDLVVAAATQIGISAKQAEYYSSEKQQANSLAALYSISHELSKYGSIKEVAERCFPLIQKELPCRRMWIGVLNESGSHIAGQAGYGPGIRKGIINIQIELYLRHDFLDEALKEKRSIIVKPGSDMECSGLNNIMRRLELDTFIIVPLVALGQVVGIMVVEPSASSSFFAEKKLPLLNSMAGEIATVLLARRFEVKMAEAEKMRMAGMLASGVAHNFNNLLQAVMGQASLIEMQVQKDSAMGKSSKMIIEAATKGAALVSQLLSFSSAENNKKRNISIENLIGDSKKLYGSIVGQEVQIKYDIEQKLPNIFADYGQLQQIMNNILVNAKDAVLTSEKKQKIITITARQIKLKSGEVDPELAPGSYVRVDIEDNGIGMDNEQQARCFEPFYTSKNNDIRSGVGFSGSGLGLSSSYSIMKQHEGIITVRSKINEGSVFSLYLPISSNENINLSSDVLYASIAHDKPDVLFFDLEEAVHSNLRPVFESVGLRSVATSSSKKALQMLKNSSFEFSSVIIEVDKFGYDILSFIRSINKDHPEIYLTILTGEVKKWSRLLLQLKNFEILQKPLGVWALHALARKIVQHKKSLRIQDRIKVEVTSDPKLDESVSYEAEEKEDPESDYEH